MLSVDRLKFQRQQLTDLCKANEPRETPEINAWTERLNGLHAQILRIINEQRAAAHKPPVIMKAALCDLAKEVELPLILPENAVALPEIGEIDSDDKRIYGCCTFAAKLSSCNDSRDPLAIIREAVSFRLDFNVNQMLRVFSDNQSEPADRYNAVLEQCDELLNSWIDGLWCQMYSMRCNEVGIDVGLMELAGREGCRLYLIVCVIFDRPALYVQLALECERIWEGSYTYECKQDWASNTLRKFRSEAYCSLAVHIESVYHPTQRRLQLPDISDELSCIAQDANTLKFDGWLIKPLYVAVQAANDASKELKFAAVEPKTLGDIIKKIQDCADVAKSDDHLADDMLKACKLLDKLRADIKNKLLENYPVSDPLRLEVLTNIERILQYLKSLANAWKSQNAWRCIENLELTQKPNGPDRLSALKESSDTLKKIGLESWNLRAIADQLHSYALSLKEMSRSNAFSHYSSKIHKLQKLSDKAESLSKSVRQSKRGSGTEPSQVSGQVSDLLAAADDLQLLCYCEMIRRLSTATKSIADLLKLSAAQIDPRVSEPVKKFSAVLADRSKSVEELLKFCRQNVVTELEQCDRKLLVCMQEINKQMPDSNKIPRIVLCENMKFDIAIPVLDNGIVQFYMNHLILERFINNLRTISSSYSSWSEKVPGSERHHQQVVDRINRLISKLNTIIDMFLPLKNIFLRVKNLSDHVESIVKLAEGTDRFCTPLMIEATMLESEVNLLRRGVRAVTRQPTLVQEIRFKADKLDALAANLKKLSDMAKEKTVNWDKLYLQLKAMRNQLW